MCFNEIRVLRSFGPLAEPLSVSPRRHETTQQNLLILHYAKEPAISLFFVAGTPLNSELHESLGLHLSF